MCWSPRPCLCVDTHSHIHTHIQICLLFCYRDNGILEKTVKELRGIAAQAVLTQLLRTHLETEPIKPSICVFTKLDHLKIFQNLNANLQKTSVPDTKTLSEENDAEEIHRFPSSFSYNLNCWER